MEPRELGETVPVSIGTALAFEAVFTSVDSKPPAIGSIGEFWINCRTLIRNILGAYTTQDRKAITANQLAIDLHSEIQSLDALVSKHSNNRCKAVFYVCTYNSLQRKFPNGKIKERKTELQKYEWALENNALRIVHPNMQMFNFRVFDTDLDGRHPTAFILTHYAVDLLSKSYFERLALVESHTGVIKPPTQWYTKLTNGNDLPQMPFNKFTLQVFGDRNICFTPFPNVLRDAVIKMSKDYAWSPATTKDKILYGIKALPDPIAIPFFMGLW